MQSNTRYPRWFHTFGGLLVGLAVGCGATWLAYELGAIPVGDAVAARSPAWGYAPLAVFAGVSIVLAAFEACFAVRRHRALRRAMDGRTSTAEA